MCVNHRSENIQPLNQLMIIACGKFQRACWVFLAASLQLNCSLEVRLVSRVIGCPKKHARRRTALLGVT